MPTIHVPGCHGGSFTLLPSLKCNYSWWRSNVSCVTDNQTAAKSIWCNWLRINCGTRLLEAPRTLIVAFSSLGRSHTLEYGRGHQRSWYPLFSAARSAPLTDAMASFLEDKSTIKWHMPEIFSESCHTHVTRCPCCCRAAILEPDASRFRLPEELHFVLTICLSNQRIGYELNIWSL